MIIDSHTHFTNTVGNDTPDPSDWLSRARRYGIDHAVVLPMLGLFHDGHARFDHDMLAKVAAQSAGLMLPFCTAQTWLGDEALAELERCLRDLRFRGVKFHPWLQGLTVSSAAMDSVCDLAAQYDVPILYHDGTPPFSLPAQIALLARRHPGTRIILGHCGLFEHWREALAVMQAVPTLWGCLCSPYGAALRELLTHCDTNRLVWGSDAGYGSGDPYPYRMNVMRELGVDEAIIARVMGENARRLLGL